MPNNFSFLITAMIVLSICDRLYVYLDDFNLILHVPLSLFENLQNTRERLAASRLRISIVRTSYLKEFQKIFYKNLIENAIYNNISIYNTLWSGLEPGDLKFVNFLIFVMLCIYFSFLDLCQNGVMV